VSVTWLNDGLTFKMTATYQILRNKGNIYQDLL
jgi:hypothetical protein